MALVVESRLALQKFRVSPKSCTRELMRRAVHGLSDTTDDRVKLA